MNRMICYLHFEGNAREAMQFYANCMNAELGITTFGESECGAPPEAGKLVFHSQLTKAPVVLMASDALPGMPFQRGNNFFVCIDCESRTEIEKLFGSIGEGGTVETELQDMFWGDYFGTLTDRFGVRWMFSFKPPE